MWDDEDVHSEGCYAIADFFCLFSSNMFMQSLMFMLMVNICNVAYNVTLCWCSWHVMFGLSQCKSKFIQKVLFDKTKTEFFEKVNEHIIYLKENG